MFSLNESSPVGDWVSHHPTSARVFDKYRIDYCCGGSMSLNDACKTQCLDSRSLLLELQAAQSLENGQKVQDWTLNTLTDLCDHIEQTHHNYLRQELPRLSKLIEKVASVHGERNPSLHRVNEAFCSLRNELEPHMAKEEQILFPAVRLMEASKVLPQFHFGTIENPIRMMEHEHDLAGRLLIHIRKLLNDFQLPEDACNSYRAMLKGLEELETDLHSHIHKENHILFPRAVNMEVKVHYKTGS